MPTHEEQAVLAAYNGWGGLKESFIDGTKENTELKALLTPEEYNAAKLPLMTPFIPALTLSERYGKAFLVWALRAAESLTRLWV